MSSTIKRIRSLQRRMALSGIQGYISQAISHKHISQTCTTSSIFSKRVGYTCTQCPIKEKPFNSVVINYTTLIFTMTFRLCINYKFTHSTEGEKTYFVLCMTCVHTCSSILLAFVDLNSQKRRRDSKY